MMSNDLYEALQRCIELVRSGVSFEESLAKYPAHAGELRPLLLAATDASGINSMSLDAKLRVRRRVLEQWDRKHSPRRAWWTAFDLSFRWPAAVAAVVLLMIVVGGVGTAAAAQNALPGSSLYSVKQLREEARLWIALSPDEKVEVYVGYVGERASELSRLAQSGEDIQTEVALARLEEHLSAVDEIRSEFNVGLNTLQSLDSPMIGSLGAALLTPEESGSISEVLSQTPPNTYPCLQHIFQVLQQARSRVSDSLETLGRDLPSTQSLEGEESGSLCPR